MDCKIINLSITMAFGGIKNTVHPVLLWDKENKVLVDCGFMAHFKFSKGNCNDTEWRYIN